MSPHDIILSNISDASMATTDSVHIGTNEFDNDSYEVISQENDRAMDVSEDNDGVMSPPLEKPVLNLPPPKNKSPGSGFSSDDYEVLGERSLEFVIPNWEDCVKDVSNLGSS